jgi:hypothetical protein
MNPVISGGSHYFRIGVSKETFTNLNACMYHRAQRYMKRRHPRKSGRWRQGEVPPSWHGIQGVVQEIQERSLQAIAVEGNRAELVEPIEH